MVPHASQLHVQHPTISSPSVSALNSAMHISIDRNHLNQLSLPLSNKSRQDPSPSHISRSARVTPGGGMYTSCREFPGHYWPVEGAPYWQEDSDITVNSSEAAILAKSNITSVVPFFNEGADELKRTLHGLYEQALEVAEYGYRFHVLIIMDGWWKASESMWQYVHSMFPDEANHSWTEMIQPIPPGEEKDCVSNFVIQRLTEDGKVAPVYIGTDKNGKEMYMKLSLLVKRDNRRKSNSHEWFLQSFAPFYNSEFIFLTDCGTLFEKGCLFQLTRHLTNNHSTTACTGRQRVMTKEQQGVDSEDLLAWMWREAQCYDYECSQASFTGAFSLFGMLPVIPGPCGLYRFSRIYRKEARALAMQAEHAARQQQLALDIDGSLASPPSQHDFKNPHDNSYLYNHQGPHTPLKSATSQFSALPSSMSLHHKVDRIYEMTAQMSERGQRRKAERDSEEKRAAFIQTQQERVREVLSRDMEKEREEQERIERALKERSFIDAVEFYCEMGKLNPDEAGMVEGNLLLAEDRILSFAAVLKADWEPSSMNCCALEAPNTEFVPGAVFYFEAETNPETLLQQRRRWINGTVAGYYWLLFNKGELISSSPLRCCWQTSIIRALIGCQLIMYVIVGMAPAIFGLAFRFSLTYTFESLGTEAGSYVDWFLAAYMLLYLMFVFRHSRPNKSKLSAWLFTLVIFSNMMVSAWILVTLVLSIVKEGFATLQYVVLGTMALPFLLALHSLKSFRLMLKSAIPFYLLLPTMVGYFGVYAFSRTWELTWGNRPSDKLTSLKTSKSKEQQDKVKQQLNRSARTISTLAIALNVLAVFILVSVQALEDALLYMGFFVFGWAVIQMFFSGIFLIRWRIRDLLDKLQFCFNLICCARCKKEAVFLAERHIQDSKFVRQIKEVDFGVVVEDKKKHRKNKKTEKISKDKKSEKQGPQHLSIDLDQTRNNKQVNDRNLESPLSPLLVA